MVEVNFSLVDGAEPMKQTAIRLPEYQFVGLRQVAQRENRNVSAVIRQAIRIYLEAYQEQANQ